MIKLILPFFLIVAWSIDATVSPYRCFLRINHEQKVVYFAVPKTGYNTVVTMLLKNNIPTSLDYNYINLDKYESYFKFAFVRNPWDRVVSAYVNLVVTKRYPPFNSLHNKGFESFVDHIAAQDLHEWIDIHIKLQTSFIPDGMHFIGRFENFSEDLKIVLDRMGLPDQEIVHTNKSEHSHYSHYYNDRTREIIAEKYKEDIEAFGYYFEADPQINDLKD